MRVNYLPPEAISSAVNVLLLLNCVDEEAQEVDVVNICTKHFGLSIHFVDLKSAYGDETLGMIITEHKLILCDTSIEPCGDHKEKKERILRFTLAHELGHYLFHRPYMTSDESPIFYAHLDPKERNRIEIQANIFASMLLMPEKAFKETYQLLQSQSLKDSTMVRRIAELFNVSWESVSYRLEALEQSKAKA